MSQVLVSCAGRERALVQFAGGAKIVGAAYQHAERAHRHIHSDDVHVAGKGKKLCQIII